MGVCRVRVGVLVLVWMCMTLCECAGVWMSNIIYTCAHECPHMYTHLLERSYIRVVISRCPIIFTSRIPTLSVGSQSMIRNLSV